MLIDHGSKVAGIHPVTHCPCFGFRKCCCTNVSIISGVIGSATAWHSRTGTPIGTPVSVKVHTYLTAGLWPAVFSPHTAGAGRPVELPSVGIETGNDKYLTILNEVLNFSITSCISFGQVLHQEDHTGAADRFTGVLQTKV